MSNLEKGVYWPSFFMFVAIVLALMISIINGYVFWWLSVSMLFFLSLYFSGSRLNLNPLTIAVFLFLFLLIINMVFIRPVNDSDASYLIGFFLSSFLLFSFANEKFIRQTLYSLSGLFLLLALWGLLQYFTGYGYLINVGLRANALFFTPNTYAACLNIVLLPLSVFYCYKKSPEKLLALILILFMALLVSQSRGGWVAFIAGVVFALVWIKTTGFYIDKIKFKKLIISLILVFIAYNIINLTELNRQERDSSFNENINQLIRSDSIVSTMSNRFELYDIAWQRIKQHPFSGYGFHTYQYFQIREQQAPFIGNITRFVHNDYLQLWMETGIFGLVLFISIPIIIIVLLVLLWQRLSARDSIIMLALTAGLVSFYVHALVDFLFYTPFLLMMYGCYLGYLNQLFNKYLQGLLHYKLALPKIMIRPVIVKSLIGLVVVGYLSQPAIAQLAFDQANRYKNRLDIASALSAYELARRFAPYESSYYLVEGDIWYHAAKATGKSETAQRADRLFEEGVSANPYRVKNLFWRAMLHRDYPELLSNPVSTKMVLSWLQNVLTWLPHDQKVQAEYVRTLSSMGEYDKAKQLLDSYLRFKPDSRLLKQVKSELGIYPEQTG